MEYIIPDAFFFVLYVWQRCVLFIAVRQLTDVLSISIDSSPNSM
jgi:hypothetical protein